MLKETVDLIHKLLICRHEWEKLRAKDGGLVTYHYIGGHKVLHHCRACHRLKWFDVGSKNFPAEPEPLPESQIKL